MGAERVVLAVPVGSPDTVAELREAGYEVLCVVQPPVFRAVSVCCHVCSGKSCNLTACCVKRLIQENPQDIHSPLVGLAAAAYATKQEELVNAHASAQVGMWYEDFGQTEDAEVMKCMERTKARRLGGERGKGGGYHRCNGNTWPRESHPERHSGHS
eukprot:1157653-Pelagomonas_calceolata.AAC.9